VREVTLLGQNVNAYGLDLRRAGRDDALDFASSFASSTPRAAFPGCAS